MLVPGSHTPQLPAPLHTEGAQVPPGSVPALTGVQVPVPQVLQAPTQAEEQQIPPTQKPDAQPASALQAPPTGTSAHAPEVQLPVTQSLAAPHFCPTLQLAPQGPPQSRSVSPPFCAPSPQLALAQTLPAQTPLAQCPSFRHSTQAPAPLQNLPPTEQVVPATAAT